MKNTKKTTSNNADVEYTELIGLFFHSVKDGKIEWQGEIVGNPQPGWYMVQLFGWIDGIPNVQRLMRIEDMREWLFYEDTEIMQFSYDHGVAREGGKYRDRLQVTKTD